MDSLLDSTIIIQESMIRLAISHTHGVEHSLSVEHFYHLMCATTASHWIHTGGGCKLILSDSDQNQPAHLYSFCNSGTRLRILNAINDISYNVNTVSSRHRRFTFS